MDPSDLIDDYPDEKLPVNPTERKVLYALLLMVLYPIYLGARAWEIITSRK